MSTFYLGLRAHRQDGDQLAACVERVVNQLDETSTMLLGPIQSAKTCGFSRIIARAFDLGYPFWWPVLVAPHDAAPVVYASAEAVETDE